MQFCRSQICNEALMRVRSYSCAKPISSPEPAPRVSGQRRPNAHGLWDNGQSITGSTVLSFRFSAHACACVCVHALSMRRGYVRDIKGAKSHRRRLFFALLSFLLLMQHAMVSVLRALAQQSVDEMTSSLCIGRFPLCIGGIVEQIK